ncbi:MAG: phosphatase PAP2 family protein [Erysipelotrichaceae bacterium]|nr:phosphatase PAP2 family protein [Erysipelotrichaceae bacterium]
MEWEVRIIEWIQSNLGFLGTHFAYLFSFVGGEMGMMVLLVVVLFCWKKEVGQKLALVIASVHTWLSLIKAAVLRLRPYMEYPDRVKALAPVNSEASLTDVAAQGYSFPSMHSGATAASYFTLAREIKKKWFWIFASVLIFLVGFFRVVTGNHYPTDVLAGWTLGFATIGVLDLLEKHVKNYWIRNLILLATTLPGLFYVSTDDYYTSLGLLVGVIVAIPFEQKYVKYEDTRNIPAMILRTLGGFALYFGLNTLLKMPFSSDFLESETLIAFLVRTARYAIIMFVIVGVYPKVFPLFEKIRKSK